MKTKGVINKIFSFSTYSDMENVAKDLLGKPIMIGARKVGVVTKTSVNPLNSKVNWEGVTYED